MILANLIKEKVNKLILIGSVSPNGMTLEKKDIYGNKIDV